MFHPLGGVESCMTDETVSKIVDVVSKFISGNTEMHMLICVSDNLLAVGK